jgi:Uma2 family endonuclease
VRQVVQFLKTGLAVLTGLRSSLMSTVSKPYLTAEEYLAIERKAETKHEFYRGEMFAMVGGSRPHNHITVNIAASLWQRLRDGDCIVYSSDQRVKVAAAGLYTYPDVTVQCGEPEFEDQQEDTLLNPLVLVEVLSPSTADYDRGGKFALYRQLPSLQQYVLVGQDRAAVEHYVREADHWLFSELKGREAVLSLPSLACDLPLADIYLKVQLKEDV